MNRRLEWLPQLLVPCLLIAATAVVAGLTVSAGDSIKFRNAIISVAIVVSVYAFIGNSGVISFGHISFVAVGAFSAGVMTIPVESKTGVLPTLFPLLRDHTIPTWTSPLLAALLGAVYALLVGIPLMRLSGLSAGIATLAVLGITYNILTYWTRIGPGATTLSLVPDTTNFVRAAIGAISVVAIAYAYQRSRWGRQLRATREDPAAARAIGIDIHRQRLFAFVLSGGLAGFSGALLVHLYGSITTNQVYLDLTFLTLAMLVVGGVGSLLGAVVGALVVSFLTIVLQNAEEGISFVGVKIDLPSGSALVGVAVIMLLMLLLRPQGLTGGREASLHLRIGRPSSRHDSQDRERPSTP